jgi:hypothetical protein
MQVRAQMRAQMRLAAGAEAGAEEGKRLRASPTRFALDWRAAGSNRRILPTKALAARPAQTVLLQMKERKSRPSCPPASVPALLPIHFYCRERSAKGSPEMARADLARTDWYPAILREKVYKVRAEDAAARVEEDPVADKVAPVALVDPVAGEAAQAEECLLELLVAEEQVAPEAEAECLAGAAD